MNAPGSRPSMPDLIEEVLSCRSPEPIGPLQFCFLHPMHGSARLSNHSLLGPLLSGPLKSHGWAERGDSPGA